MDLEKDRNKLLREIEELEREIEDIKKGSLPILPSMRSFNTGRKRRRAYKKKLLLKHEMKRCPLSTEYLRNPNWVKK
jgi:hypothetical protein